MPKKYISLEAANKWICETCDGCEGTFCVPCDGNPLKDIPAADVVEVVRCCECIYHDDESQYHYCRKWRRNCPNDSDFFCKWGKRENGGRDE